jgi:peptidoglycan-associated lipoprotein
MKRYSLLAAFALLCACRPVVRNHGNILVPEQIQPPDSHPAPDRETPSETVPSAIVISDPPTPPVPTRPDRRNINQVIVSTNADLLDAFFPYDRSDLSTEAIAALRKDADILRPLVAEFPTLRVTVEGHCDERGSAEYNLGLGDHRARRAADLLERFGLPSDRIDTVSYGKESPQCTEPVESCWSRNRRAHLTVRAVPPGTE